MSEVNTTPVHSDGTNPPQDPEWRARYIPRPEDEVAKFDTMYQVGQHTYTKGRRGYMGPYTIHQSLGNGSYKLKNERGEIMPKTYAEGELYQNPSAGNAMGV